MSQPYTPRPDTLPASVVAFFQFNPDEELALDDIVEKFNAGRNNIHTQLSRCVDAGLLTRVRNDDGEYLYQAGASIKDKAQRQGQLDDLTPAQAPHPLRRCGRVNVGELDLKVEHDVPLPAGPGQPGTSKWDPLFQKLTKPNDSIEIPAAIHKALRAEAKKRTARDPAVLYRVLFTGNDRARIWRLDPTTDRTGAQS